ncbi:hypothetical protein [Rubrivivax benzoatilyticus]|uniref:ATP-binding protein n=1 Tax=Rubrivivax benzoatilyticus TaxID=316997 RepID=A0ABX0HZN6_9BURK|nr:hypothetical protein [Rubrivivax benzoatilyticus]NHK99327.1 hypothetical protein [Rubrivivax benzoatilyticus]NHL25201.1 hypothetical protein [Rubrivivax benzoatilyticus]
MIDPNSVREAIIEAPFELDNKGETPHPGTLYIPLAHRKALAREATLVVGARGVGKSFWTSALSNDALRNQIGASVQDLVNTDVRVGFAVNSNLDAYPDRATFRQLLCLGKEPETVWKSVVLRWLAEVVNHAIPRASWTETAQWVANNPESFARIAEAADTKLAEQGRFGLIVFDAMDRTSADWDEMNRIVRDVLQVALWMRGFSQLRAKVFLRPDQLDRSKTNFVDASKILSTRVDLTWDRSDLHAMMWQRLINAAECYGENIRTLVSSALPPSEALKNEGSAWKLPTALASEAPHQRRLFELLAGDKMGKDARRGVPYVWSVSHLADGHGWTSPRSFLAAIHGAAEDSRKRYGEHPLPLHYESIKRGIQKASKIRVEQVAEDDSWVPEVMAPLKDRNVPSDYETIRQQWESAFPNGPSDLHSEHLPPQHREKGWDGVRLDLERLGILVTRRDGRVDMPDLYRVGFGLGRRGGVRPGH